MRNDKHVRHRRNRGANVNLAASQMAPLIIIPYTYNIRAVLVCYVVSLRATRLHLYIYIYNTHLKQYDYVNVDLPALSLHHQIFHHYYVHGRVDGKMVFPPPSRVRIYIHITVIPLPPAMPHQPRIYFVYTCILYITYIHTAVCGRTRK